MQQITSDAFSHRESVIRFIPEQTTDDAYHIRFTTQRAIAMDPRDEGFVLDVPRTAMTVLSQVGRSITAAVSSAVYAACEMEGLVILPPRR